SLLSVTIHYSQFSIHYSPFLALRFRLYAERRKFMSLSAVAAVCDRRSALIERRYNLCRSVDGERNRTESPNEKNAAIPRQAQTSHAGQLRARTHQETLSRRRAV